MVNTQSAVMVLDVFYGDWIYAKCHYSDSRGANTSVRCKGEVKNLKSNFLIFQSDFIVVRERLGTVNLVYRSACTD